jgi:hypothetical protein
MQNMSNRPPNMGFCGALWTFCKVWDVFFYEILGDKLEDVQKTE